MSVSDSTRDQSEVTSNMTVVIKTLSQDDVTQAVPITLDCDPRTLIKQTKVI